MYKSIKNIFLGIIFLSFFLIPNLTFAGYDVKGDDSKTINNLETGSWYRSDIIYDTDTGQKTGLNNVSDQTITNKGNANLFSSVQTKTIVSSSESEILRIKLKKGGSSFDIENLSTQMKTGKNPDGLYVKNTPNSSIYAYDPTPKDKNNGDDVILAVATKDGRLYVPKDPVLKDQKNIATDSLDPKTGNGFLNLIDADRGFDIGSTINEKNDFYNKTKEKDYAQEKLNEAEKNLSDAQKALINFQKTGTPDAAKEAELRKNIEQAELARNQAYQASYQAQQVFDEANRNRQASANTPESCDGVLGPFGSLYCVTVLVSQFTNIIFKFMSFMAYVVGLLFDYSLEVSMNSAEFFKQLGVVEITWTFLRDVLNITFIFILLWAAIQILIGNEGQYNAKKVLMHVVIVAILINFSLFAAKLMVDGSNIVSLRLYESMKVASKDSDQAKATISERIMNTVGMVALYDITKIFNSSQGQGEGVCKDNPGALITVSVMGSIFLLILSMALGLAAILFIVRLVNIIFLFIRSPLWVWGYVLPGNSRISKLSSQWMSEMKHVLLFPIVYLFWMLVAVIMFDKLGKASNGQSLLDMICQGSNAASSSIALVLIFVIVIIVMMKAIGYAVKNATTDGAIGGEFAKKAANKFNGWQDAATKGLAKKTWEKTGVKAGSLAAGAGIGAYRGLKNTSAGLAGGTVSALRGKGFEDGFYNPGINAKEGMRDLARSIAANNPNGVIGSMAAKFADKYKDPKNSQNETRKETDARRTKSAEEDRKRVSDAINEVFKAKTQDQWKKENPSGTDKDYENHLEDMITKRTEALLGSGITRMTGSNGKSHLENLRQSIESYDVTDASGKKVTKIRLNEEKMATELDNIIKHHTEGAGVGRDDLTKSQRRKMDIFRAGGNATSKARIKAIKSSVSASKSKGRTENNQQRTTESFEKTIQSLTERIKNLPDESTIDTISNTDTTTAPSTYSGYGSSNKDSKIPRLNQAIIEYNRYMSSVPSPMIPDPTKVNELKSKIKEARDEYVSYLNETKAKLAKTQSGYSEHIQKIEEAKK